MVVIYNFAFIVFAFFYFPFFLLKARQEVNPKKLIKERFGFLSQEFKDKILGKKIIWVHAVSVGEVLAIRPFVEKLRHQAPEFHIVLSTVTATGQKLAREMEGADLTVCYFPFDLTGPVRSFFKILRPKCLVLVETEIWPNLLTEARKARIPVGVINARLSQKSFRRYYRYRYFFKNLFKSLRFVFTQASPDAHRFLKLGVPSKHIEVLGNMKFDISYDDVLQDEDQNTLRSRWQFTEEDLILIGGSTHEGEEKALVQIAESLRADYPNLRLLIAPRHIERSAKIKRFIEKKGFKVKLASDGNHPERFDALVLDQLGVLKSLYLIADFVFVGGSLVKKGGQNPIEPAQFKKVILHGPFVSNFELIYSALDQGGGAIYVRDAGQLEFALKRLIRNRGECETLGKNAHNIVTELRGSTEKHVDRLLLLLNQKSKKDAAQKIKV